MLTALKNAANLVAFFLTLPVVIIYRFLLSFFVTQQRSKPWRRVVGDEAFRWFLRTQNIPFIATLFGSSHGAYVKWCKKSAIEPRIEQIDCEAQIFWVGEEDCDRVILYLHGGGFSLPLTDYSMSFWKFVVDMLQEVEGLKVRLAMLDYTLVPDGSFPVPLCQTVEAVNHLLRQGVKPENIQLTGDSAGGNLLNQFFLHMLHPVEGVPLVKPGVRFKGAYFMSPWPFLLPRVGVESYTDNSQHDIVSPPEKFADFGRRVLSGLQNEAVDLPYVDASYAPDGWYEGYDDLVESVLITAGGAECLKDDILEFADILGKAHKDTRLVVDRFGVHDDPFLDFLIGEKRLTELTPLIIQWVADRFQSSNTGM
ncbi:hypothetical protein D9613_003759 [Agrocybe pediades]|uniref:Alpha/beta hydrolase fold-3 domain-containing protein n=1 Tax=Agrocybe pediades TaxID=84607 RepID=A0A8H4QJ62_9AGAR|nr:hypothetical protein D9613_003759 [Agrocybe pediades]